MCVSVYKFVHVCQVGLAECERVKVIRLSLSALNRSCSLSLITFYLYEFRPYSTASVRNFLSTIRNKCANTHFTFKVCTGQNGFPVRMNYTRPSTRGVRFE